MIVYPSAKINLGLRVIRRREDGFHDLETFFIAVDKTDILEVTKSPKLKITHYGLPMKWDPMEDICVKAYHLMRQIYDIPPVEINLVKRIPVGSGLGGGSSDAAGTIIAINRLFKMELSLEQMVAVAAKVGSDCSFFIYAACLNSDIGEGMIAKGRGDLLTPFIAGELSSYNVKIVVPDIFISTAEAYREVKPVGEVTPLEKILSRPIESWRDSLVNDFESSIFLKYPAIAEMKQQLYNDGAVYASLSGSGSALYAFFKKR